MTTCLGKFAPASGNLPGTIVFWFAFFVGFGVPRRFPEARANLPDTRSCCACGMSFFDFESLPEQPLEDQNPFDPLPSVRLLRRRSVWSGRVGFLGPGSGTVSGTRLQRRLRHRRRRRDSAGALKDKFAQTHLVKPAAFAPAGFAKISCANLSFIGCAGPLLGGLGGRPCGCARNKNTKLLSPGISPP